ncbi:MAG: hypothetical protein LBV41_02970 [Cytophagaceae bacterium]|jgi:uncharacterized protein YfcZ (UPF0381/DUF406 family)|nr:hypothetical protein [Cytophagaceae bacterium]
MEEMTVSGVISLFPSTKAERDVFVERLIDHVTSGYTDPLKVEIQMANIEQVVKKYRSDARINECVLNEAAKYGQKSFNVFNAKIEVKEVGVKYNYDEVGHPLYDSVCAEIDRLAEKKKELEQVMKAQNGVWIYTDPDTGEIAEVSPVCRTSTTKAVITINK